MNVITFDLNTKYAAYALFIDGEYSECGRVVYQGVGDTKIASVTEQLVKYFGGYDIDVMIYESAYVGVNPNVAKELSKVVGAVLGAFYCLGVRSFLSVPPITWQTHIGVGKTSRPKHLALRNTYPDKSTSWIKNRDRENRKQLIIDYVNKRFGTEHTMSTNDEADAIGIGCYAMDKWPEVFGEKDAKVV